MDELKLTSIRLPKSALSRAAEFGRSLGFYKTSDVIRIAIWVGFKIIKPSVLPKLMHMIWEEEAKGVSFTLEDVLRTAGVNIEHLKKLE